MEENKKDYEVMYKDLLGKYLSLSEKVNSLEAKNIEISSEFNYYRKFSKDRLSSVSEKYEKELESMRKRLSFLNREIDRLENDNKEKEDSERTIIFLQNQISKLKVENTKLSDSINILEVSKKHKDKVVKDAENVKVSGNLFKAVSEKNSRLVKENKDLRTKCDYFITKYCNGEESVLDKKLINLKLEFDSCIEISLFNIYNSQELSIQGKIELFRLLVQVLSSYKTFLDSIFSKSLSREIELDDYISKTESNLKMYKSLIEDVSSTEIISYL